MKAFLFMVAACIIGNGVYSAMQTVHAQYIKALPFEKYAQYYSIEPERPVFKVGEELKFVSDSEFKLPVSAYWSDILQCDFYDGHGFGYYRVYTSSEDYVKPRDRKQTVWAYPSTVNKPASCFLDSTTRIKVEYGIEKTFNYHSQVFEVQ